MKQKLGGKDNKLIKGVKKGGKATTQKKFIHFSSNFLAYAFRDIIIICMSWQ
jgi:hypothetical protein